MSHILVVDDEPAIRAVIRQILEHAGHSVVEAENGCAALACFKRRAFDLVITDIIMPQGEGIETILAMRKQDPDLQIIAISGGGRTKHTGFLDLAEKLGANQILPKPFTRQALMVQVQRALGKRHPDGEPGPPG